MRSIISRLKNTPKTPMEKSTLTNEYTDKTYREKKTGFFFHL